MEIINTDASSLTGAIMQQQHYNNHLLRIHGPDSDVTQRGILRYKRLKRIKTVVDFVLWNTVPYIIKWYAR